MTQKKISFCLLAKTSFKIHITTKEKKQNNRYIIDEKISQEYTLYKQPHKKTYLLLSADLNIWEKKAKTNNNKNV